MAAPDNYIPLTNDQRSAYNDLMDHVDKIGGAIPEPGKHFDDFKKENPSTKLASDLIPHAQYEVGQLKTGNEFAGLEPHELKYAQDAMTPAYKNGTNPKYPITADGKHVDEFAKGKGTPPPIVNTVPGVTPNPGIAPSANVPPGSGEIPKPDYNDPKSRLNYVIQAKKKYGNFISGRGDTLLHMNETPDTDEIPVKEAAIKAAKPLGIDPVLLYSSAMEEGMSGLFPDKNGKVTVGDEATKDYPVAGFYNFGMDHFSDVFPELAKRGYLPKDFDYQKSVNKNENHETVNSANFKTVADALQAKAAYLKMFKDDNEKYAKEKGIELSPKAQQFFTLISYNGGPGTYHKMLNYYNSKGLLKDDKFVDVDPGKAIDPGKSFSKVAPRLKMADVLRKEGLF